MVLFLLRALIQIYIHYGEISIMYVYYIYHYLPIIIYIISVYHNMYVYLSYLSLGFQASFSSQSSAAIQVYVRPHATGFICWNALVWNHYIKFSENKYMWSILHNYIKFSENITLNYITFSENKLYKLFKVINYLYKEDLIF